MRGIGLKRIVADILLMGTALLHVHIDFDIALPFPFVSLSLQFSLADEIANKE